MQNIHFFVSHISCTEYFLLGDPSQLPYGAQPAGLGVEGKAGPFGKTIMELFSSCFVIVFQSSKLSLMDLLPLAIHFVFEV